MTEHTAKSKTLGTPTTMYIQKKYIQERLIVLHPILLAYIHFNWLVYLLSNQTYASKLAATVRPSSDQTGPKTPKSSVILGQSCLVVCWYSC